METKDRLLGEGFDIAAFHLKCIITSCEDRHDYPTQRCMTACGLEVVCSNIEQARQYQEVIGRGAAKARVSEEDFTVCPVCLCNECLKLKSEEGEWKFLCPSCGDEDSEAYYRLVRIPEHEAVTILED